MGPAETKRAGSKRTGRIVAYRVYNVRSTALPGTGIIYFSIVFFNIAQCIRTAAQSNLEGIRTRYSSPFSSVRAIRRGSTRRERAEVFSRQKCKARTVVGRGEKSLLCDPGSELTARTEREEKGEHNKWDAQKKNRK